MPKWLVKIGQHILHYVHCCPSIVVPKRVRKVFSLAALLASHCPINCVQCNFQVLACIYISNHSSLFWVLHIPWRAISKFINLILQSVKNIGGWYWMSEFLLIHGGTDCSWKPCRRLLRFFYQDDTHLNWQLNYLPRAFILRGTNLFWVLSVTSWISRRPWKLECQRLNVFFGTYAFQWMMHHLRCKVLLLKTFLQDPDVPFIH